MTEHPITPRLFQNRLIRETSPYLLQHAHNPVDWYPWGEEAFKEARAAGKPVFLSIGYSTCHWCHVMAHESFEDTEVADLMNEVFICIKADREERPDIDKIYMNVCQLLTGSGGWPLTIVMTPEGLPFYAATYLPKKSQPGRMGMMELIPRIQEIWFSRRNDVLSTAKEIVARLRQAEQSAPAMNISGIRKRAYEELKERFDNRYGGFLPAPKFPMPHQLSFLLRYWKTSGDPHALSMVEQTLLHMQRGGLHDHIGYGFHRYSTDEMWLVPHFEKMLYDQALLALVYVEAYQATGNEFYRKTAQDIFGYVLRDMASPAGGFYTAEDADSEGSEGKFYLWTYEEMAAVLDRKDLEWVSAFYNIKREGNYLDESVRRKTGMNILHPTTAMADFAKTIRVPLDAFERQLERVRQRLFDHREKRIHPHKDDKILTDWNGLMIAALSEGARVLGMSIYQEKAQAAIDFIHDHLRDGSDRLFHCYRSNSIPVAANLDDYAFFIWGLINYYEASFNIAYLKLALTLQADCTKYFLDPDSGGYFFTPSDGENIIFRQKEVYDGATPSGNAVTAVNLIRLARLTGRHDLEADAQQMVQAFSGIIDKIPSAYTYFMTALHLLETPSQEVVVVGKSGKTDTEAMLRRIQESYLPNLVVLFRPIDDPSQDMDRIAPFTADMTAKEGKATAYICSGKTCLEPTIDLDRMFDQLQSISDLHGRV